MEFPERDHKRWSSTATYPDDPLSAFEGGYRAGLLKAARMASAFAGRLRHRHGGTRVRGRCVFLGEMCSKCAALDLAASYRRLAKEADDE